MQLKCLATKVEKGQRKECMVTHACDLSTWAAKARKCLQVRGQPKLHCEFSLSKNIPAKKNLWKKIEKSKGVYGKTLMEDLWSLSHKTCVNWIEWNLVT